MTRDLLATCTAASRRLRLAGLLNLVALGCLLAVAPSALAASGRMERAWGKDVVNGGDTGFEICTVAANCKHGGNGGLGGEMVNPGGVAFDGVGNVYVVDSGQQRVEKYDTQGKWQRAWGKDVVNGGGTGFEICTVAADCKTGAVGGLGGELFLPGGIAADAAGNVYVADSFNNRVQEFDSQGNWQRAWGKDVVNGGLTGFEICTIAANCKAGTHGGGSGELDTPLDVATDGAGKVYVADQINRRVAAFDSQGNFLRAWGKDVLIGGGTGFEIGLAGGCQAGSDGTLGGGMGSYPSGVGADAAGNVYVSDNANHRIQKFDSEGNWQRAWGKDVVTGGDPGFEICTVAANCKNGEAGALGGEMTNPGRVAPDAGGGLYVSSNGRIEKFDSQGNWQRAWGKDVVTGGGTGFEICIVSASCKVGVQGGLGGEFDGPYAIAADNARNIYVTDVNNVRIQKFADPVLTVQKAGTGAGTVTSSPGGIA